MDLLLLGLLAMAAFEKKPAKKKVRKYYRRPRKNNDWLDMAWFHDHNHHL